MLDATSGETYYILCDTDDEDDVGGLYTLEIEEFVPPPGDNCADPSTAADGSDSGDTTLFLNDYDGACEGGGAPASGPDQVWEYEATCSGTLTVTMDTTSGGDFACTLDLWTTCGDITSSLDCENDGATFTPNGICEVEATVTSGTTYYILCDTNNAGVSGGEYSLEIDCT
jgi:hypothetical protein